MVEPCVTVAARGVLLLVFATFASSQAAPEGEAGAGGPGLAQSPVCCFPDEWRAPLAAALLEASVLEPAEERKGGALAMAADYLATQYGDGADLYGGGASGGAAGSGGGGGESGVALDLAACVLCVWERIREEQGVSEQQMAMGRLLMCLLDLLTTGGCGAQAVQRRGGLRLGGC